MDKKELRKHYIQKRKKVDALVLSKKIQELLFSRLMMHRYDRVHCYLSASTKNEVDTTSIFTILQKDFPTEIYVPKAEIGNQMSHHLLTKDSLLEKNAWGINEPIHSEGIDAPTFFNTEEDILILVPMLVCDKNGHRLGYGGGYYDRFLEYKTPKTTTVGLSFFEPIDVLPEVHEKDCVLDFVICPNKVWQFNKPQLDAVTP